MAFCKVLMTEREIMSYNHCNEALAATGVIDIAKAPAELSKEEVLSHQEALPYPKEARFDGCGHFWGEGFYRQLAQEMDWQRAAGQIAAEFGLMSEQAQVRTFPTEAPSYRERWKADLDRFQVTLLKLGEPVLIWQRSLDGCWFFVQNRHTWGWVRAELVALTVEPQWRQWAGEREFVQCLCSREIITYQSQGRECQQLLLMGTHLTCYDHCHAGYIALLPRRTAEGRLRIEQILLPKDERFSLGYLPLSQGRLLEQGLKCLGEPYGWGGENGYRDCTSLVDDVFGVFGFTLARNSSAQRQMAGVQSIPAALDDDERQALVEGLPVGTVLYLPGHAMIYLGRRHEQQAILHSVYQMGLPMQEELVVYRARQVMRGHLRQLRVNGQTFLTSLTEYWCPWQ